MPKENVVCVDKLCKLCKVVKPVSHYQKGIKTCRTCNNLKAKERYKVAPTAQKQLAKMKAFPVERLLANQRERLKTVLQKKGLTKLAPLTELLGCHKQTLELWLESNFSEEMTWQNMGHNWQVDHVKAMRNFDLSTLEGQKACCNWSNLFPLDTNINQKKAAAEWADYQADVEQRAKCFMNECDCC